MIISKLHARLAKLSEEDQKRMFVAAGSVMRERMAALLPDDKGVRFSEEDFRTFFAGLSREQWRKLKRAADQIESGKVH